MAYARLVELGEVDLGTGQEYSGRLSLELMAHFGGTMKVGPGTSRKVFWESDGLPG